MARITRKKICPSCGVIDFTRKHRSFWMRWFPGSRFYQCRFCRSGILLLGETNLDDVDEPDDESAQQVVTPEGA